MNRQLLIRLTMRGGTNYVISCQRPDGTVTWQKQPAKNAGFFAAHDLTHYAVETVLGYRSAFYGLLAGGWDFPDFAAPWPRGRLPAEAGAAELIVGLLDAERAGGGARPMTAAELNATAETFCRQRGVTDASTFPRVTDEQLSDSRDRRAELLERWTRLPPGEAMELVFEVPPVEDGG